MSNPTGNNNGGNPGGQNGNQNGQRDNHHQRAQNKDNLDSRKNEEFDTKGDDVTHNKKEQHSESATVKEENNRS